MSTILDQLADYARVRVEKAKENRPIEELREAAQAVAVQEPFRFEHRLSEGGDIHFICECKKASPSKGLIAPDFPYLDIARH